MQITINKTTYDIIDSKTADDCDVAGLVNMAREMRRYNIVRQLVLVRPNGKKMFDAVEYSSGKVSTPTFLGWM